MRDKNYKNDRHLVIHAATASSLLQNWLKIISNGKKYYIGTTW